MDWMDNFNFKAASSDHEKHHTAIQWSLIFVDIIFRNFVLIPVAAILESHHAKNNLCINLESK